jgi:hypothetical protein
LCIISDAGQLDCGQVRLSVIDGLDQPRASAELDEIALFNPVTTTFSCHPGQEAAELCTEQQVNAYTARALVAQNDLFWSTAHWRKLGDAADCQA